MVIYKYPFLVNSILALISLYDEFINKYELKENINPETGEILEIDDNIENVKSGIQGFIKSIKKDITPIKAAISFNESSGFVEGNNNKFKLIKRILYGRFSSSIPYQA